MIIPTIDENARRRFESAWLAGQPLAIDECLPPSDGPGWLSTLEELVHIELEFGWKAGRTKGPLVEDYLKRFPRLGADEIVLRLTQQEFDVRHEFGDRPPRQLYRQRFPEVVRTGMEIRGGLAPALTAFTPPQTAPPPLSAGASHTLANTDAPSGARSTPAGGHVNMETVAMPLTGHARYTLVRLHAEGGLGRVWIARDADLNRDVALKELKPSPARHPEAWQRFLKEAQITGQLEHPNIVPVYELGRRPEDNQPFYTMRFIHGRTLHVALVDYHERRAAGAADPIEWLRLLQAFASICNAVSYAHSRGVIHRDLKPENVVLGEFGEVLVLDWGLAKLGDSPDERSAPVDLSAAIADSQATISGHVVGTPAYMSPEQAEGLVELFDARTDVYGLGAILFAILTGRPPHHGDDSAQVLERIVAEPTPEARAVAPTAPRALSAICAHAMAKSRDSRYPLVAELARDFQRYLADEPVSVHREPLGERTLRLARRHRIKVATAAAAAIALLISGGVGFMIWHENQARVRQEAADRLVRVRTTSEADEAFALAELQRGDYSPVDEILSRAVKRLADKPELADLYQRIKGRYDRLRSVSQFYRLSTETERLAFFEYDDRAERTCTAALATFNVLADPQWSDHLPDADLTDVQRSRLREEVLRQLLMQSALRVKQGLMHWQNAQGAREFRSALEPLTAADRFRPTQSALLLAAVCWVGTGAQERGELPTTPNLARAIGHADNYFLGLMCYWVSQMPSEVATDVLRMVRIAPDVIRPIPIPRGMDLVRPLEQSANLLRRAADLRPNDFWTYLWLGRAQLAAKRFDAAELSFDACIALRSTSALGYAYRGRSLLMQASDGADAAARGDLLQRGFADLDQARTLEPTNPEFLWFIGDAYAAADNPAEALANFEKAADLEPPLETWARLHIEAEKQRHFEQMRDVAAKQTIAEPDKPDGWIALAVAAWRLGQAPDAERAADKALLLQTDDARALAVRGEIQLQQKQYDGAILDFNATLGADPKSWPAAFGRATALAEHAKPEQALAEFDKLLPVAKLDWQIAAVQRARAALLDRLNHPAEAAAARQAAEAAFDVSPPAG